MMSFRTSWTCTWPPCGGSSARPSSTRDGATVTSSMRDSLRARLILWYAGVLASVVVLFGVAVSYQTWRSMIAALDQELRLHALQVAAALRPAGDGRFDVELTPEALEYFRQD